MSDAPSPILPPPFSSSSPISVNSLQHFTPLHDLEIRLHPIFSRLLPYPVGNSFKKTLGVKKECFFFLPLLPVPSLSTSSFQTVTRSVEFSRKRCRATLLQVFPRHRFFISVSSTPFYSSGIFFLSFFLFLLLFLKPERFGKRRRVSFRKIVHFNVYCFVKNFVEIN